MTEINWDEIVENAFGDDLERVNRMIDMCYMSAVACGCGRCMDVFNAFIREKTDEFYPPNEDDIIVQADIQRFAPKLNDDDFDETDYIYTNT